MRVKARWEALDEESTQIAYAKACGKMYHAPVFANGDTRKQLLWEVFICFTRRNHMDSVSKNTGWNSFQGISRYKERILSVYAVGLIYHQCKFKDIALTRLARWYDEVDKSGFPHLWKGRTFYTNTLSGYNQFFLKGGNQCRSWVIQC